MAAADPTLTFDQRELSIRSACGHHVDALRHHFAKAGLNRRASNRIIGDAYRELQVRLRDVHASAVAQVQANRARAAQAAQERAREAEADQERQKVFAAASQEHRKCVADAVADLLLSSSECAEAVVTAAMTRCTGHEVQRVQLGMAMYRVNREFATKAIAEDVAKIRTAAIATVVELRAAANRARQNDRREREQERDERPPDRAT